MAIVTVAVVRVILGVYSWKGGTSRAPFPAFAFRPLENRRVIKRGARARRIKSKRAWHIVWK